MFGVLKCIVIPIVQGQKVAQRIRLHFPFFSTLSKKKIIFDTRTIIFNICLQTPFFVLHYTRLLDFSYRYDA